MVEMQVLMTEQGTGAPGLGQIRLVFLELPKYDASRPPRTAAERIASALSRAALRSGMRFVSAWRVMVVGLCWLAVSAAAVTKPLMLVFAWPLSGPVFLVAALGSVSGLRTAASFGEPLSVAKRRVQALRVLLALLACSSIAGAITAVVPSMAFRPEGTDLTHEYGLSVFVAPALWGAILAMSISALVVPSPRRLALVSVTGIVSWPLLLAIRGLREPFFDIDDEFFVLAPWALQLYVVAVIIASGIAMAVAFAAARMVSGPAVQMPPKASVLNG